MTSIVRPFFSIQTGTLSRRLVRKSSIIALTIGSTLGGWQENTSLSMAIPGRLNTLGPSLKNLLMLSASIKEISIGMVLRSAVSCSTVMCPPGKTTSSANLRDNFSHFFSFLPVFVFYAKADRIILEILINVFPLIISKIGGTDGKQNICFLIDHLFGTLQNRLYALCPRLIVVESFTSAANRQ